MRITKVYTKTGDDGTTSLADGTRILKNNIRIETYGTVDELNACLGIIKEHMNTLSIWDFSDFSQIFISIQNGLFNIGSDLATPLDKRWKNMIVINEKSVDNLEKTMDYFLLKMKPLQDFVLPGGSLLNSYLHLARTICRRAERLCVTLEVSEQINHQCVIYLNRLSDLFFVLSRYVLILDEIDEVLWKKDQGMEHFQVGGLSS